VLFDWHTDDGLRTLEMLGEPTEAVGRRLAARELTVVVIPQEQELALEQLHHRERIVVVRGRSSPISCSAWLPARRPTR